MKKKQFIKIPLLLKSKGSYFGDEEIMKNKKLRET